MQSVLQFPGLQQQEPRHPFPPQSRSYWSHAHTCKTSNNLLLQEKMGNQKKNSQSDHPTLITCQRCYHTTTLLPPSDGRSKLLELQSENECRTATRRHPRFLEVRIEVQICPVRTINGPTEQRDPLSFGEVQPTQFSEKYRHHISLVKSRGLTHL